MLAIKDFHALVLFLWVKYLAMFLANKPHIKAFIDDLCVQSHVSFSLSQTQNRDYKFEHARSQAHQVL